ncbi:43336_t:CDS:2, partial [Gigaspora margarita]
MVVQHILLPEENAIKKIGIIKVAEAMHKCDLDGSLMIYVTKLYNSSDILTFDVFDELSEVEYENGDDIGALHNRLAQYKSRGRLMYKHSIIPAIEES